MSSPNEILTNILKDLDINCRIVGDIKTDEEIRIMAGHPDIIPPQYIEWFLKGYRECEKQNCNIKSDCRSFEDRSNCNGFKQYGNYACRWCESKI